MNKISVTAAAVALGLSVNLHAAPTIDFHGYTRAGVGTSADGGQQIAYEKAKLGRLGNESDIYGEIQLGSEVYNNNGRTFYVDSMVAMTSNGSNDWESTSSNCGLNGSDVECVDDAQFALRQFNVRAQGVLTFAPEAIVWAGKRFYQRHDIHITDFFYWNVSGSGAGVEGIDLARGKLSVAWLRNDRGDTPDDGNDGDALNVNTLDARYAGIPMWHDASLEVGVDYAIPNATAKASQSAKDAENGLMFTAELTQNLTIGFNKTILQYGTEGYSKVMALYGDGNWYGAEAKSGASGYRAINTGVISLGDSWEMGHQLVYALGDDMSDSDVNKTETWSAVIRPVFKWDEYNKSILELGYAEDRNDGAKNTLGKVTVAQAWSAGSGFWARPEIRLYATYLTQDNADGSKDFDSGLSDNTVQFGVQAEVWW